MVTSRSANHYSLLADIGGTNTRVALCEGTSLVADSVRRFRNAEYGSLEEVLAAYMASEGNVDCLGACVAAAGPVRDSVATMTNLDWTIDSETVAKATGAETVSILNDLQAQGHALGHLEADALTTILPGKAAGPNAAQLVVGVGTGFNAAPVWRTHAGRFVAPSECGHITLPVRSEEDLALSAFVEKAHGFPGVEDLLSGRGLERIYAFHATENNSETRKDAASIMTSATARDDDVALRSVETFCRKLGDVIGDLALVHLPFGGIFLIGGVGRAMVPFMGEFGFADAFRDKGRFAEFQDTFAVTAISDDYAALIGCANHLHDRMNGN
ncbi:ROK family protein [Halocynthiibacter sp. C4]|uniref:glucokinase n=1 Tax=Halocynthiibacter sp. C4 TaxID=2992758 RepID=UPI00237B41E8|nr:ROK family protein [Halocynthiibacter sp. C4]MDE0589484.1 ROK family protein [Halocynthiibacter sp. C4]